MAMYRSLQPAGCREPRLVEEMPDTLVNSSKGTDKQKKRQNHSEKEWDQHRAAIIQTYASHTLEETAHILSDQCGFKASRRQYKKMLRLWNVEKNRPNDAMSFIVQTSSIRSRDGKRTMFLLNGCLVNDEEIQRFALRHRYPSQVGNAYPPQVTPTGVEYFTPYTLNGTLAISTPQVFTPITKWSYFAREKLHELKCNPACSHLLHLGSKPSPIQHIKAVGLVICRTGLTDKGVLSSDSDSSESEEEPDDDMWETVLAKEVRQQFLPHEHSIINLSATGQGRFVDKDTLQTVLWSSYDFAIKLFQLSRCASATPSNTVTSTTALENESQTSPEYWIESEHRWDLSNHVQLIIDRLRQDVLIKHILGLSLTSIKHWIGPWKRMPQEKARLLMTTAIHLFGNADRGNHSNSKDVILVHIDSLFESTCSLLLKISVVESAKHDCRNCDAGSVTIDLISMAGALKIQIPIWSDAERISFDSKEVKRTTELQYLSLHGNWSIVRNFGQGPVSLRKIWYCPCRGAVHKHGFRCHYIDVRAEHMARSEKWDIHPLIRSAEDIFTVFPGESDSDHLEWMTIHNPSYARNKPDDALWDPLGTESSRFGDDRYEPYPSEDESMEFFTKARLSS